MHVLVCVVMQAIKNQDSKGLAFFTRSQLARRWAVSAETLKRRERAGILRPLKLGRGVRYKVADVERVEAEAEVSR
jgi:hypothetical protein